MKKLKAVVQYECMTSFKYIWVFYAIQYAFVALIMLIIGISMGTFEEIGTSLLEINSLIYVGILGALGFSQDFKLSKAGDIMRIYEVSENKKKYIELLFLADEQEDMIERYLEKGTMYVLEDDGIKGECVVTEEGGNILEIKNLAVVPDCHKKGYGRALIEFIAEKYREQYCILQVGTGDSPLTIPFYEKCGFVRSHSVKNFFTDNYDHPIYEGGVQLKDMIYLRKQL